MDELLAELGPLDGTPAARHALETALLDLVAQQERVPLAALLVRAPLARRVRVAALLSEQDPAALATQAREATDAGHDTVKIKVGVGSLSEDIDRLSAVRAAVGDRGLIRIDANGAWTRVVAEEALNALAPHRIELCEQPVPADDVEGLGALRSLGLLRIGADETLSNPEAAQRLIETRGVDVLVLKPMVLGGLRRAVSLAQRAAKQGMTAYVSSSLEGPIGRLAALHVAVAMGDADHAHGLGVGALFDPSARPSLLEPQAGTLGLLEEPGLGLSW